MKPGTTGIRLAALAFAIAFVALIANGRAIGSGDTNVVEKTAATLAQHGSLILPEGEPLDPFTRPAVGGRVSIYPALSALMAAPFFWVFSLFFDLNPTGIQVAGKLTAALFSSVAIAIMATTFQRRTSAARALASALTFGVGTSLFSTAQALWQHPAVLVFLSITLAALDAMESPGDATRLRSSSIAALSLALTAACRPACIPMCAILFLYLIHRRRPQAALLITIALLPAMAVGFYNQMFFGAPWRFGQSVGGRFFGSFPESIVGLLVSPGRGLLVFTPIALLAGWALIRAARSASMARGLSAAALAHFLFISSWNEWHGGESFGPRLLTDMLPLLFFFLPEALDAWPKIGAALAVVSVGVQLIGGWTYDYRWERLHQRGRVFDAALWSWTDSPLAFALREGVVLQGIPDVEARRVRLRVRRFVPFGPQGSIIEAMESGIRTTGAALFRDLRMERAARVSSGRILLQHPADALAFRALSSGRFDLRLIGMLHGTARVETAESVDTVVADGDFDSTLSVTLNAGDDVFIRSAAGELRLARVELRTAPKTQ